MANTKSQITGIEDSGIVVLLSNNTPTASTTSASLETLRTLSIPGGLMGANDTLKIEFGAQKTGTAGTWAVTINMGGQLVINESSISAASDNWTSWNYIQNANSVSSQIMRHPTQVDLAPSATSLEFYTNSVDTSADFDITFESSVANAADSSAYLWTRVTLIRGTV